MLVDGKIHYFGDNIDTDQIIPSQYLVIPDIKDMAVHTMEPINNKFYKEFKVGDIIVAGRNFGCGSSREQAVHVLKEIGTSCIIAESFSRIFYRNCINLGLPIIEVENTEILKECESLVVDFENGIISGEGKIKISFPKYSGFVQELINCGGLVKYYMRNNHKKG